MWIDVDYDVHENIRNHICGAISMGYVIICGKASEQKINIKSSMWSKTLLGSEYFPYNLQLMMFL